MTINLDAQAYATLLAIADREDAPIAQVARRAITDFLNRQEPALKQPAQPLIRSTLSHPEEHGT